MKTTTRQRNIGFSAYENINLGDKMERICIAVLICFLAVTLAVAAII
ncbi:MAG: hypothetical protein AB7T27_07065 [Kiritimatiellia bacterium]